MNELQYREERRQLVTDAATAAQQTRSLAEQVGIGRFSNASLNTAELCARVGDRVTRAALPDTPRKGRGLLPTQGVATTTRAAAPGLPEAVLRLLDEIDAYDPAAPGRAHTVAQYAVGIAGSLAADAEIARIRHAALLCNIGLAAVPRTILNHAGPLTADEQRVMRRHPIRSAELLDDIPALRELILLVLHHHEACDGSGYPYGLSGEWIPRGARIIRVAESYEALMRSQPYRPALAPPEALAVLHAASGAQLDSASVAALVTWLDRGAPQDEILSRWWRSRQSTAS